MNILDELIENKRKEAEEKLKDYKQSLAELKALEEIRDNIKEEVK